MKVCKSCGKEIKGEYCESCGYGNPDLEITAYDKYKVKKPERFMTDEEKAHKAEELKEKREAIKKQTENSSEKRRQAQKKNSQWGFILVAIGVFAVLLLLLLYNNGYIFKPKDKTGVISKYFNSIESNNFDGYLSTMVKPMANEYRDYVDEHDLSKTEAMKELYSDYIEGFGKNYTIKLEFGREVELDEATTQESEQILHDAYGFNCNIKEAYKVTTTVTFKGSKAEEVQEMYVYVAKIGRSWYILNIEN